jgi:hypothetical protein
MSSDRKQQVNSIFHSAMEREGTEASCVSSKVVRARGTTPGVAAERQKI